LDIIFRTCYVLLMVEIENSNQKESTIVIKNKIRERLKKKGYKGQTYNEIIARLLDLKENKLDSLDHKVESLKSSELSSSTNS
jgi:hypothetical protein